MDGDESKSVMLYRVLGEVSADIKHLVTSTNTIREDQRVLRDDMKSEMRELRKETQSDISEIKLRLDAVERFNIKVLAYASVAAPVILAAVNWLLPKLGSIL